jgi:glycerophosphoryl diester phosphodiesterase
MNRLGELFELFIALAFVVACHVTKKDEIGAPLYDKEGHMIIRSSDFQQLKTLHSKFPGASTTALIEPSDKRTLKTQLDELGFTPTIYSPHFSLVTPGLVQQCHKLKIKIIPWTVNDKNDIDKLKSYGVDGIITDYPDLLN